MALKINLPTREELLKQRAEHPEVGVVIGLAKTSPMLIQAAVIYVGEWLEALREAGLLDLLSQEELAASALLRGRDFDVMFTEFLSEHVEKIIGAIVRPADEETPPPPPAAA